MSDKIKVYQKPTCSKCRTTLGILRDRGADFEAINYYEKPLSVQELRKLIDKLGITPRDLLRKGEHINRMEADHEITSFPEKPRTLLGHTASTQ